MKSFDVKFYLTDWRFRGKPSGIIRMLAQNSKEAGILAFKQISNQYPHSFVGTEVVE